MFSATLHSPEVRALAAAVCEAPLLVDLKGREAVPDTVDHVLVTVDAREDRSWLQSAPQVLFVAGPLSPLQPTLRVGAWGLSSWPLGCLPCF